MMTGMMNADMPAVTSHHLLLYCFFASASNGVPSEASPASPSTHHPKPDQLLPQLHPDMVQLATFISDTRTPISDQIAPTLVDASGFPQDQIQLYRRGEA